MVASEPFSKRARRAILSSVIVVVLGSELRVCNPTLPKIATVATGRPAAARLLVVAPAGRSVASYTTTRDTTCCTACVSSIALHLLHGTFPPFSHYVTTCPVTFPHK